MIQKNLISNKGFTLIELMVSLAIFAFMTALLVSKYGTFNQGILLNNLAYDVALTLRTAQSFGLNTKSAPTVTENFSDEFYFPYGVHFDKRNTGSPSANTQVIFFVDSNPNANGKYGNGEYDSGEMISTHTIKRGSYIEEICVDNGNGRDDTLQCNNTNTLDVTFERPDPDATLMRNGVTSVRYAEIVLRSSDGGTKRVGVSSVGQIAVKN